MKTKITHFIVAFVLFTTVMYFGLLWLGNESDRASIGNQSLLYGFFMAIFEVFIFSLTEKYISKN